MPRIVMLSYGVTEEAGGPAVAAAGFAGGLAGLGADVTLIALDNGRGRWLVDDAKARAAGYEFRRVGGFGPAGRVAALALAIRHLNIDPQRPNVIWVNGIWGAQSIAAALVSLRNRWPYVIRPAGSLGRAALKYKWVKKRVYYWCVESPIVRHARAIHCMSAQEVAELPAELRSRAFIVPSGVDLVDLPAAVREPCTVGVLARLHPIKNHHRVLDAVETLVAEGQDLALEFAGASSDPAYAEELRRRVAGSALLADRVRFLGHVDRARLPDVVGRWRAALLLSEQENFGHAVISAAAFGVPTVASAGVGLARDLEAAGAGVVVGPHDTAAGLARILSRDATETASACRAFAARFGWDACSRALLGHLQAAVSHEGLTFVR